MRSRNTDNKPVRTFIYYSRVNRAVTDDPTAGDQGRRCHELAKRLGWEVVDVYIDSDSDRTEDDRYR